ncbi:MAG: tetratricopeptide repeat protein [Candidatus Omnitrophota bacterium]|nr:tetratricopeptide repeat protein [Candidatus Omnitrophota bacterium]
MAKIRALVKFAPRLDMALGLLAIAAVFALIFGLAHRAIFDADIWLHLKAGQMIWQEGHVPSIDDFSLVLKGRPWVDHEWLFQVITYLIYSRLQAEGLIILECVVLIAAFFILFIIGHRQIKSYLEVAAFLLLAAYASVGRFNIRPDIFSMLFFAAYLYLLRFHAGGKWAWLAVPIQALWVNFHGYFFLGPLLIFFYLLAELMRRKVALPWQWQKQSCLDDAAYRRLFLVFIFSICACLLNPRGLAGAFYPLGIAGETFLGRNQVFFQNIEELKPTFVTVNSLTNAYALIILFSFGLLALNFRKIKIADIFLISFFFFFALTIRNVAFFAFAAFTVVVSCFSPLAREVSAKTRPLETPVKQAAFWLIKYGLLICFLFWIGDKISLLSTDAIYDFKENKFKSLLNGVDEQRYPKEAAEFLRKNNFKGNLFNDFNSGAYLIGSAYPALRVFIDGRTELYGPEFFKEYKKIIRGDARAFEKTAAGYNISACLFSRGSLSGTGLVAYLYRRPAWKLVFFDDAGAVFLKDSPANAELVNKYKINLKEYRAPAADLQAIGLRKPYPGPYLRRAAFFEGLGEYDLVIDETKQALRVMPNCARAFHLLGRAYSRQGRFREALEGLRSALLFSPDNLDALADLGSALRELKDNQSALRALRGALKINPRFAPAYYELGRVYLAMDNPREATRALRMAIKYSPAMAQYHLELSGAYFALARKTKQRKDILKSREELSAAAKLNIQADAELAKKIQEKRFLLHSTRLYDKNK